MTECVPPPLKLPCASPCVNHLSVEYLNDYPDHAYSSGNLCRRCGGNHLLWIAVRNRGNDNVWYYRCNSCTPRHSYTWGGAGNWQRFASRRVHLLRYMTDLLISDVAQMGIDNYNSLYGPDHTMMVTGRNSAGWALVSYHTDDTRNKPLNLVMRTTHGPFWAFRT